MNFKKGDYVTRKSYNNDTIFKILNIKDGVCYLKGEKITIGVYIEISNKLKQ